MKNLTKESLLKAIQKIDDNPELLKGRESFQYDLIYNGNKYPPILVISEANKIMGGKELFLSDFGNSTRKAFKVLKDNNFNLIDKRQMNLKNEFTEYLNKQKKDGSNKANSYLRAIDLLNEILRRKTPFHLKGNNNVWSIESEKLIEEIYDFVLTEQTSGKSGRGGIFIDENPSSYWKGGFFSAALKSYKEFLEDRIRINGNLKINVVKESKNDLFKEFELSKFNESLKQSGLHFTHLLIKRFVSSLLTKPFLILTGLSGSGKTKLAQAFVQWICQDKNQYCIVPVGADWTNREPLLGYPNALNPEEYVKPDSGVLDLIIRANKNTELPFFLILDEMNLSIVERYFADFLSVMESREAIPLYAEGTVENGVPTKLSFPSNLFIIGTVNIDETTNMFSPKVLDRANTIEFRVTKEEMKGFLRSIKDVNMEALNTKGAGMAESFLQMAKNKTFNAKESEEINKTLVRFFGELKKTGAEFGYRSASEIIRLINQLSILDDTLSINEKLDIAIMQKLLPKLHGSRRKLCPVLVTLGSFCIDGDLKMEKDVFEKDDFDFNAETVRYPLSLEKIARMHRGAIDNGFASFAEA